MKNALRLASPGWLISVSLFAAFCACGGGGAGGGQRPPSDLAYSKNPATYTRGFPIAPNTPSIGGGAAVSYSVSPALPEGLGLDASTGVITGTPLTVVAAASHIVTATNPAGSTTAALSIAVLEQAPPPTTQAGRLSLDSPAGQDLPQLALDSSGNAVAVWIETIGYSKRILWSRYSATSSSWSAQSELVSYQSSVAWAAVASNGTTFLVAYMVGSQIQAAVSSGEGWAPATILSSAYTSDPIVVASNGAGYAVAWTEYGAGGRAVLANVFDGSSWHEDQGGGISSVRLSGAGCDASAPALAGSALGYAAAWLQQDPDAGTTKAFASIFDAGAWQVDGEGKPAPTELGSAQSPWSTGRVAIASDGAGYAAAWIRHDGETDVVVASLRPGAVWAAPHLLESHTSNASWPAVASNGAGYAFVWLQTTAGGAELRGEVFVAGSPWPADVLVAPEAQVGAAPAVVASGAGYLAAWIAPGATPAFSSLWSGGAWQAPERLDAETGLARPVRLVSRGAQLAAIFPQDDASGANRIFVNRRAGGAWGTPQDLVAGTRKSTSWGGRLATARDGTTLALWTQYRNGVPEVVGRLNRTGEWEEPGVIASPAEDSALATDGAGFLVAWISEADGALRARRWMGGAWTDDVRLSPPGQSISRPVASSDGHGYAVAWMAYPIEGPTWTIEVARFVGTSWEQDGSGNVLATRVDAAGGALSPSIASNGTGYCVVWQGLSGNTGPFARIHDGSSWGAAPAHLGTSTQAYPAVVASDGDGYAVAWSQQQGDDAYDVYVNRFDATSWQVDGGGAPAPTLLEDLAGRAEAPAIASNGTGYAVAWKHWPTPEGANVLANVYDGTTWQTSAGHPAPASVNAVAVSGGNVVLASDGTGYAVSWSEWPSGALLLNRHDGTSWQADEGGTPEPTEIGSGSGMGADPSCMFSNGRTYSIVWEEPDEVPWYWDKPDIWAQLGI